MTSKGSFIMPPIEEQRLLYFITAGCYPAGHIINGDGPPCQQGCGEVAGIFGLFMDGLAIATSSTGMDLLVNGEPNHQQGWPSSLTIWLWGTVPRKNKIQAISDHFSHWSLLCTVTPCGSKSTV